ncbi:MAG: Asp-tRNA(Asn)/Glu-tRNA(Gln) amidotransferase subunit GatC [Bacteroidota bacterium]
MQITDQLIDKVAKLGRLRFEGEKREEIKADFQRILDFVDKLQEVDTQGVEPLIHITQEHSHLRKDEPHQMLSREAALTNAPKTDGKFFLVPKVVKK